jgi:diacylglycerol O-acyltransferase / wax synthase
VIVTDERLGAVDAAWLQMDGPENTADVVALLTFRALPPPAALRALLAARLLSSPRFHQRIAPGALPLARPRWREAGAVLLDDHLVTHHLPSVRGAALREVVGAVASTRLDPARPLWRVHLVEAPDGGALVAKIHHCIADGFALVGLLLSLGDAGPPPGVRHALPASRRLAPWLDGPVTPRALVRSPLRALRLAAGAGEVAAALARLAALPQDPPTLLSRPLTGRQRAAWSAGVPLRTVRRAARARGATVNDVVVAAVAGALRSLLASAGERVDALALRALVPVNLRASLPAPGEPLGNRFGLVFLDLPISSATPAARLEEVRASTARVKGRPDALATLAALAVLGTVPPRVEAPLLRFFARKASVVVTNVPGPREPLVLAGEPVESAMFWVPHPSTLGLGVSVLSYAGELRVGVRADEAVLDSPADLVARFEAELAALC